jgi:GTP-binding protein HflX
VVRRAVLPDATPYTLTATVGFVRHLPHQLVDAFRSTLDEVAGACLVLHVVDASAPDAMGQVTTVRGVLHESGAAQLPELLALNKADIALRE